MAVLVSTLVAAPAAGQAEPVFVQPGAPGEPSRGLSSEEMEEAAPDHPHTEADVRFMRGMWPPAFVVARAFLDQLERNAGLPTTRIANARTELDRAERLAAGPHRTAALTELAAALTRDAAGAADADRVRLLVDSVRNLAGAGD